MWCYSLRFPRIRKIKLGQTYMDCITFQELQMMGHESISAPFTENNKIDNLIVQLIKNPKRVRFIFDDKPKEFRFLKSEYFVYISRKFKLKDREEMTKWLDDRGFESIWSFEAALSHSDRKLIVISCKERCKELNESFDNDIVEYNLKIDTCDLSKSGLQIEGAYFTVRT